MQVNNETKKFHSVWGFITKMQQESLDSILKKLVQRLDMIDPADRYTAAEPLSRVEALARIDPILDILLKNYVDAVAQHQNLVNGNGPNDPMTEVALDMLDSARSAMQARLLEMQDREDEESRTAIMRRMRAVEAANEAEQARLIRKSHDQDDLFTFVLLWMWATSAVVKITHGRINARSAFALASDIYGEKRLSWAG